MLQFLLISTSNGFLNFKLTRDFLEFKKQLHSRITLTKLINLSTLKSGQVRYVHKLQNEMAFELLRDSVKLASSTLRNKLCHYVKN